MKLLFLLMLLTVAVYADDAPGITSELCNRCDCNAVDAQVFVIDCKNKNLDKLLGPWPVQNTTKIRASFTGNNIVTLETFSETNVTLEVVLSKCNITYLKEGLFVKAKNVKFLDLSYNQLSYEEVSAEKFRGPGNENAFEPIFLEHLNLSYNHIHSLDKNLFEHLPNLKVLDLEGNDFTVLDIPTQLALSSVKTLESLNLANNELTELVKNSIKNLHLIELNLGKNQLDFVPESLGTIGATLEVLILDHNPIIEMNSETFLGLNHLQKLSANDLTQLKYVDADAFLTLENLQILSLSNNPLLKDISREAFAPNQTLRELYLNNNNLYRIDHKLLRWSQLQVFRFEENPLDCSCDLYNITMDLPRLITRNENSAFCTDPRTDTQIQVFYLKSDICGFKSKHGLYREAIQHHFSLIRVTLIILSVILMLVAFVAVMLAYIRYKKYQRNKSYPFASQVLYNPLSTNAWKF